MTPAERKNAIVLGGVIAIIALMLSIVAYSPTLYRWFCSATGYGGTTVRVAADHAKISKREVTVSFDTNVAPGLPWRFAPEQGPVKVHLGQQKLVFFSAQNMSNHAIVAHATYNVTPQRSGLYFKKIQCFCFNEERLEAHQKVDMPVVFFVDPALASDPTTAAVHDITLSYTFFRSVVPQQGKELSRLDAEATPDPARGETLFTHQCSACHSLTKNKIGPMLGGVFGRKAGTAKGYDYSPALQKAGLNWTAKNLDQWLLDPHVFIPGVRMPVRVPDPFQRRDLIAWLEQESRRPAQASLQKPPATIAERGGGK
ncbi:MAG TPA: cytochrome c oxidase assembly protein [Beijerinckiaceae bacterium]|nr:cytochrome c oxidase assembly protein [Beijerinckiaceae bacterium]